MNGEPVLLLNNVRCAEKLAWGFGQKMKCRCISLSDAFDFQGGMISDRTFGPFETGQMCNWKCKVLKMRHGQNVDAPMLQKFCGLWALSGVAAWVEYEDALLPFSGVDVGVDFGGENALVSEHLLDGPQVGSVLDQMCGEGVAEGVGRYFLGDAGLFALAFDHQEYHLAAQFTAAPVQEKDVLGLFGYVCASCLREIQLDGPFCRLSYGYKSLFVAFTCYPYERFVEKQVGDA